jgi:hypothetical protein
MTLQTAFKSIYYSAPRQLVWRPVEKRKKSKEKRSRKTKEVEGKKKKLEKGYFSYRVILFCSSLRFFGIIHRQDFTASFILIFLLF